MTNPAEALKIPTSILPESFWPMFLNVLVTLASSETSVGKDSALPPLLTMLSLTVSSESWLLASRATE